MHGGVSPKRTCGEAVPGWGGGREKRSPKEERKVGMRRGAGPESDSLARGLSSIPVPIVSPFPTQPVLPELTQGLQLVWQNLQSTFSEPALTSRHQTAVSFTVSGQGDQPPISGEEGRDEGEKREEQRESERMGEQTEAGAQEVGREAGAEGVTGKREGGSLGSPEGSSALPTEALHPELLQNPLPSPSQAGVWPPEALSAFVPHLIPQTLAFAEPALLGLPVISKPVSANHFLHPGPCAGHSQDLSLPDSAAYDWLALSPPGDVHLGDMYVLGDTPSSSIYSNGHGASRLGTQPSLPSFLGLSCLPTLQPHPHHDCLDLHCRARALPLTSCVTVAQSLTSWLQFLHVKWWP